MSEESSPPSSFPPSLGPGARPTSPNNSSSSSALREVIDIRRTYSISTDPDRINVGYEIDSQPRRYSIPYANMPIGDFTRRLVFGPRGAQVTGTMLIDSIRGAENITGQQLSQSEVEGFALHSSKKILYGVVGNLLALGTGFTLAYAGRKTMKFPFMKVKEAERYQNFPSRNFSVLSGNPARFMWHITRANIYAALCLLAAGPLFASMGDVSMTVGLYKDGRTQGVLRRIKEQGGLDRIGANRKRQGHVKAGPQQNIDGDDIGSQGNDMGSGFAKLEAYGGDGSFAGANMDSGLIDDGTYNQDAGQQSQPTSARSRTTSSVPVRPYPQTQSQSNSDDFFFDDASPTAGNEPNMPVSTPYNRGGSSAWARVRQSNRNSEQADQLSGTNRGSGYARQGMDLKGEGSTFATSDQARQYARQQAQKEFDAMLERERRESGSNDYSRGMQATQVGSDESRGSSGASGGSAWDRRRGS